jgi:hypothetical protein
MISYKRVDWACPFNHGTQKEIHRMSQTQYSFHLITYSHSNENNKKKKNNNI